MNELPRIPADVESERLLLVAVLEDGSSDSRVFHQAADLRPVAFFDPRHRAIWTAVAVIVKNGGQPDYAGVARQLGAEGLDAIGGKAFLYSELADGVPRATRVGPLVDAIREKATLRSTVLPGLREIEDQAGSGATVNAIRELLLRLADSCGASTATQMLEPAELIEAAMRDLTAEIEGEVIGIPTGIGALDSMLRGGGLLPGQMTAVGARPSRGKTSLMQGVARSAAARGKNVLIFSLEMRGRELYKRELLATSGVNLSSLRWADRDERDEAHAALARAYGRVLVKPFRATDGAERSVASIRAEAFRERATRGLDLVVVDYLGLIAHSDTRASSYERTSAVSRGLHALCVELDVPFLVGVQLNRGTEGATAGRPSLSHFRDSGSVEQDSDVCVLIHQEGVQNAIQRGPVDLILAKQRNGPTGVVSAYFDAEATSFRDLSNEA